MIEQTGTLSVKKNLYHFFKATHIKLQSIKNES